jgi:hypothetical protein
MRRVSMANFSDAAYRRFFLWPMQTNMRVPQSDRALIVTWAQRLRNDPGFRDRVKARLDDGRSSVSSNRVRELEQQVDWLLSGAIVMPGSAPPRPVPQRRVTPHGNSEQR